MTGELDWAGAHEIAAAVRSRKATALAVVERALARIAERNPRLNAFTAVTSQRALTKARSIDAEIAKGGNPGPLAGVPFAAKNLFDIAGLVTVAGSKINRENAPAARDAALIERLEAAGAVLVGALNMGEYAYDFTGENEHDSDVRNPLDLTRMAGGSSSGSAAAVAGGLVPVAVGSDTNGSIRVPSSFCGLFGLKPTYGRLPRTRTYPFVTSFDHLGPFARSVGDLSLAYDAMLGVDPDDPVQAHRPPRDTRSSIEAGMAGLKFAVAGGYFRKGLGAGAGQALARVIGKLPGVEEIEIPEAARARAAAYVITACEAATLHAERIRTRPADFDSRVRGRLIAGSMVPAASLIRAQKFRRWYLDRFLELFSRYDVIIAPATPCTAPTLGQLTLDLGGESVPLRANIGIYTQPISFVGVPVVAAPVALDPMPAAVQIIAAPWREDIALRVARHLECEGVCSVPRPPSFR